MYEKPVVDNMNPTEHRLLERKLGSTCITSCGEQMWRSESPQLEPMNWSSSLLPQHFPSASKVAKTSNES